MDKSINELTTVSSLNMNDKLIIQQSGGGTLNTTCGDFISKIIDEIKLQSTIAKSEEIYAYTNTLVSYANFSYQIPLNGKLSDYLYIEMYCRTDDGYVLTQKVNNPANKLVSFTAGNVGGGKYFFMKCKVYELFDDHIATAKSGTQYMAGLWYHQQKTSPAYTATVSNDYIGIEKIIGYK